MKIVVLSGSPKGEKSVTLRFARFLEKKSQGHEFVTFHIGSEIRRLEKEKEHYDKIMEALRNADGVLWAFPVYFLLVPAQLKRFVELLFDREASTILSGKYCTTLTTSAHFYDHTAHAYMQAVSEDLGMQYMKGYTAGMEDLLKEAERVKMAKFIEFFLLHISKKWALEREYAPLAASSFVYRPGEVALTLQNRDRRAVIFTDATDKEVSLRNMTEVFKKKMAFETEEININDIDMKGPCLSCYRCAWDNKCIYKDGFVSLFNEKMLKNDIIVYAASIKDRFLSSRWKTFFDRSFFNGHRPVMAGKHTGYIISGPMKSNPHLTQMLEGMCEAGEVTNAGFVTDESGDTDRISALLESLAKRIEWSAREGLKKSPSFLGVGGHLIFRDLIYDMGWFFNSDRIFYKKRGLLDYPQKNIPRRVQNFFFSLLTAFPSGREMIYNDSHGKMLEPYEEALKKLS